MRLHNLNPRTLSICLDSLLLPPRHSSLRERVVDVMEEHMKFTRIMREHADFLVDRYSERRELAEDIHPQLLDARAKYTDYVEPVAEEVVATGDDGWD